MIDINRDLAKKVLSIVDQGLSEGIGDPKPGTMCVEAAVCYAMGLPHGDDPPCVSSALRAFKISLNDARWSSKEARARGLRRLAIAQLGSNDVLDEPEFARRLALLSVNKLVPVAIRAAMNTAPKAARAKMLNASTRCALATDLAEAKAASRAANVSCRGAIEASRGASWAAIEASQAAIEASRGASWADNAASWAANAASWGANAAGWEANAAGLEASWAASDKTLADAAEEVVQILVDMNVPGAAFLDLAPL